MSMAPGGAYEVQYEKYQVREPRQDRTNLRLDALVPDRFFAYLDTNWLTAQQKAQAALFRLVDSSSLHRMRMDVLNQHGLEGLYEAILETGKLELAEALRAITLHLEYNNKNEKQSRGISNNRKKPVVINCVQGKDRTGLLVMLCQSIFEVNDEDIVEDYHLSETDSPAKQESRIPTVSQGVLDRNVFGNRAPKQVMERTLQYLRSKYGSVCPGYTSSIGFDEGWQQRLKAVLRSD